MFVLPAAGKLATAQSVVKHQLRRMRTPDPKETLMGLSANVRSTADFGHKNQARLVHSAQPWELTEKNGALKVPRLHCIRLFQNA